MSVTSLPGQTRQPLSDEQVQAYHRDGFLLVEHLYSPEEMDRWKARVVRASFSYAAITWIGGCDGWRFFAHRTEEPCGSKSIRTGFCWREA